MHVHLIHVCIYIYIYVYKQVIYGNKHRERGERNGKSLGPSGLKVKGT